MGPRRIISPSSFLPLLIMALSGVIVITLLIVFYSAGYSLLLALIGSAVILELISLKHVPTVQQFRKLH